MSHCDFLLAFFPRARFARAQRIESPDVKRRLAAAAFALLCAVPVHAQLLPVPADEGANGLGLALRRLPVSGSILYVTAHPDDENNGVLVLLNRVRGLDTALLTLTRGDGGQNEIGPELFEALGVLRTEELAAVHRYDHAAQYFSRAYEFGYSFSVEETFEKWGREETLGDVVRVVRTVRPDVILTLPREAEGGGQHHQASARLAVEAFRAAADPARFPEQIAEGLRPWQAQKIYEGAVGGGREMDKATSGVTLDTSAYDPMLGMSPHQYGLLARTNHKCQGAAQLRALPGTGKAVYVLVDAEPKAAAGEDDLLAGVDTSVSGLARFARGQEDKAPFLGDLLRAIEAAGRRAQEAYGTHVASGMREALRAGLGDLARAKSALRAAPLDDGARAEIVSRLQRKEADFAAALTLAERLSVEAIADDGDVVPGQTFAVRTHVWNRGGEPVTLQEVAVRVPEGWTARRRTDAPARLEPGGGADVAFDVTVGADARYSQPYWRRDPAKDRYLLEIPAHQTLPWDPPDVVAVVRYGAAADPAVTIEQPAYFRYEGRWVGGEKQKVVNVVPALSVALAPEVAVMPIGSAARREFRVTIANEAKGGGDADVRLEAPAGWTVAPASARVTFRFEGDEAAARFFVTAPARVAAGSYALRAVASQGGRDFHEGVQVVAYDHIQERHLLHEAVSRVEAIDVQVAKPAAVAYVAGAGDDVPAAIRQLGVEPVLLSPDDLAYGDLSRFSTIVTGIRAYQTRADLRAHNARLLDYARAGGHVVVQYNKFEFNRLSLAVAPEAFSGEGAPAPGASPPPPPVSPFAPYPAAVTSARVTLEEAPVNVLVPAHPFFNVPNRIGAADFAGWVQERGLYFLGARDPRYVELLSSEDPFPKNPGPKKGLLVDAPVGKGTWTYVGLGLWRQLPAGTPGAYRLLANLLSRPRGR
jgi:LmbE family N-acetylglucosaminyl deacetylase